jgi:hypothetical protein
MLSRVNSGVEEVKPGEVHVDDEALEGPDVSSVVVKTHSKGGLVTGGLHHRPVLGRATPPPTDSVSKGRPTFAPGAAHSYGVVWRETGLEDL